MAKQNVQFVTFNRGTVSRYGLARVDVEQLRYAATKQENWMPRVLGSMMLRPGLGYQGLDTYNDNKAVPLPFIRETDDAQVVECSDSIFRPLHDLAPITRTAVATTITNPDFTSNIAGWTTADQAGATSSWDATLGLTLEGTGFNDAITKQELTVAGGDQASEHGVRITVSRGPVMLRIGTTDGDDDLVKECKLDTGVYSFGVTPNAAAIWIYFFNRLPRVVGVRSCEIEAGATVVTFAAPWAEDDLPLIRWDQSADVLYLCDGTHLQQKAQRFAARSWGFGGYAPEDGPYRPINFKPTTITPSALKGDITLVADSPVFEDDHVGGIFRLASIGQSVQATLGGVNQFSDPIRVTGAKQPNESQSPRIFDYSISGTWVGTLKLQVSTDPDGGFVSLKTLRNVKDASYADGQTNQILYYRIGFTAYTSGSADIDLSFQGGSINGDVRITDVIDNKNAEGTVLNRLGGTVGTNTWYEGAWCAFRGFPTAPALHEGRLWWAGLGQWWGSVVDAYESFDDTVIGDSAPISRTIGRGPVDFVNWLLSLQRLLGATDGTLISARSDSLDTPLTRTNFNLKFPVSQGAARIAPVTADDKGYFVHRNLLRLYELAFDTSNYIKLDYGAQNLTELNPEACAPGIVKVLVQRQPDTRIHAILSDGTVAILVRDPIEDVKAWVKLSSPGGTIEDGVVLPSADFEDQVIYIVNRTIEGEPRRYYEKLALESECVGGTLNKQADSFVIYNGAPTNVLSAPHLAGKDVIVWADGIDLSPSTVAAGATSPTQKTYTADPSGNITLDAGVTVESAVVGLPYSAEFVGAKLAYAAKAGSALTMRKKINRIGVVMADTHPLGLYYGEVANGSDGPLNQMPGVEDGAIVDHNAVWADYEKDPFPLDGTYTTDARVRLTAYAPRPCRVLGMVLDMDTEEG